ncbi:MAG: prepilin-type N-terminal cleavage/methylation domain-containing protein [Deltaproteobacteria bacterium]|nr:prepilin-type N-terminal cleavage/methylation domain-containing protein [Candidatus Zymogenaceae bacterium]
MRINKKAVQWIKMRRGFTMVEMLIAVLISFIILAAIFEVFIAQKRRYVTEDAILEMENRADFAIEYLTRIIQNSGYNIRQGMKFEAASDHYFVTAMDENDDNVIGPDEIIAIVLNKSTRDTTASEEPTELVRDPDMDDFASGARSFGFDVFFDMNGDGNVDDTERYVSGYNLNTARNDTSPDQQDSIRLFLAGGPPYAVYRYGLKLLDESSAYNSTTNPYIVDATPDLVTDGVDNFIIRYYDEENLPLPVTYDDSNRRITPKPPYTLTRNEMTRIRRVEFEVLMRSARIDNKWTDSGSYPAGTVATYDENGKPAGWVCGDSEFRSSEPYLTNCVGLSDWDCFSKYCNNKTYPSLPDNKVAYEDHYRRLLLTSSVTPKNLTLNPYGQLTLTVDPVLVRCPDTYATLTATLKDREGNPMTGAVVNFFSTSLVSGLDYSGVSSTNGDGDPITDVDGVVTGIKLKVLAMSDGTKKPVSVTVSADTAITVNVDGVDRSIPIYSSVVVPFVVGPPVTIVLENPPTDVTACDVNSIKPFTLYAEDCNGFPAEGATITVTPYNPASPGSPLAANINPGSFHPEDNRTSTSDPPGKMVDYSDNEDDNGKYIVYYASPLVTNPTVETYLSSLGIAFKATTFAEKELTDPVPDGWGFTADPEATHVITVLPGTINSITVVPTSHTGVGCENEYFDFYVTGYDCGTLNDYGANSLWASILDDEGYPSPPSTSIVGEFLNLLGIEQGVMDAKMVYDSHSQKYRLRFVTTGCSVGTEEESIGVYNYRLTDYPIPPEDAASGEIPINLTQCPTGVNIVLTAREPHELDGDGTLTDGFYQNGCDYNNIDVVANVTRNIPPTTLCEDVEYNPVTFTVVSGGARFLDIGGNPTLTTVSASTDVDGVAFAGLELTGTSLADVVISATTSIGTAPVYTDTATITYPVGEEHIVFAYRNSCYTDLLSPANGIRTGDYVYLEVLDCNQDNDIGAADTTTVTVYAFLSGIDDSEIVTLTETGNSTGIFRGKLKTRALPPGWSSAFDDGILDIVNGSYVNVRYLDEDSNEFYAYDTSNILTILDQCNEGIRFVENFANTSNDGLTTNMTNFALSGSASWRGFSTLNITRRTVTPTITPSASWFKYLLLQFCDEMFLSGSVYTQYFYNGAAVSFPPSTTPDVKWRNVESFMWVDLDESIVGDAASEQNWEDLAASYRFKCMGDPDDVGYGSTTATIEDYYLPGVDRGVFFFFRTSSSYSTMSGLAGTPTMDVIDRGYIAVWTEDGAGNPLARLFRVDGIDSAANPVTVDVVQMGGDVTGTDFNIPFDNGLYHKAEIVLDGNDFYIYFDDVLLDFDGQSGPSAVGGSSAIDKNYIDGSIGFGVKDVIAKFDNVQVCGCPPMHITASDLTFPTTTGVTLSAADTMYGLPATGPVTWVVTPSDSGTFDTNPSSGASVIFTRSLTGAFPDQFDAIDALGCIATLLPEPPAPTCLTQDFESYDNGVTPNSSDFASWVGSWWVYQDSANGNSKGLNYNGTVDTTVRLIRAGSDYQSMWDNHSTDTYDDYTVEVDVRPENATWDYWTDSALFFRNDTTNSSGYYLSLERRSGGYVTVRLRYDPYLTSYAYGNEETLASHDTSATFSTSAIYHLKVTVIGSTIEYEVQRNGVVICSGTVTDSRLKTGGPGMKLYRSDGFFDNFEICGEN